MIYVLFLNDMRFARFEDTEPVAQAEVREELEQFLERERVPNYMDGSWEKCYRQGGPLEWYNPPSDGVHGIKQVETPDEAAESARQARAEILSNIPQVRSL